VLLKRENNDSNVAVIFVLMLSSIKLSWPYIADTLKSSVNTLRTFDLEPAIAKDLGVVPSCFSDSFVGVALGGGFANKDDALFWSYFNEREFPSVETESAFCPFNTRFISDKASSTAVTFPDPLLVVFVLYTVLFTSALKATEKS